MLTESLSLVSISKIVASSTSQDVQSNRSAGPLPLPVDIPRFLCVGDRVLGCLHRWVLSNNIRVAKHPKSKSLIAPGIIVAVMPVSGHYRVSFERETLEDLTLPSTDLRVSGHSCKTANVHLSLSLSSLAHRLSLLPGKKSYRKIFRPALQPKYMKVPLKSALNVALCDSRR